MRGLSLGLVAAAWLASPPARADDEYATSGEGEVIAVRPGEVDVLLSEAATGQGVRFVGSRLLGRVLSVRGDEATVKLPVDVRVHVGDWVGLEPESGGGVDVIPPRPRGWSIAGEIRLFAGFNFWESVGSGGLQTVSSAEVTYRFTAPVAVRATLGHAALAFESPSNIAAVDASAGASLDLRDFEAGLALGAMSVNDGSEGQHSAAAFTLDPRVRIGAVDGISLLATMQIGWIDDRFDFGGAFGALSFPIANRYWWVFRGGASHDGFGFLDFGIRMLLQGNGDRGSVFAIFTTGLSVTAFTPLQATLVGPGGGIGVEVRP